MKVSSSPLLPPTRPTPKAVTKPPLTLSTTHEKGLPAKRSKPTQRYACLQGGEGLYLGKGSLSAHGTQCFFSSAVAKTMVVLCCWKTRVALFAVERTGFFFLIFFSAGGKPGLFYVVGKPGLLYLLLKEPDFFYFFSAGGKPGLFYVVGKPGLLYLLLKEPDFFLIFFCWWKTRVVLCCWKTRVALFAVERTGFFSAVGKPGLLYLLLQKQGCFFCC